MSGPSRPLLTCLPSLDSAGQANYTCIALVLVDGLSSACGAGVFGMCQVL